MPATATGDPASVPSITNCMVPVAPLGVIVAVKVTGWPAVDEGSLEATDTDVLDCRMVTVRGPLLAGGNTAPPAALYPL